MHELESQFVMRPASNTPAIRDLCERLVPGGVPDVLVPKQPPPWADVNDCFRIVERITAEHGGSMVFGWQLWETLPHLMIEAEAHAVWRSPSGALHDYTPKAIPLPHIVFLEDPNLRYEGRQIDSIRVALTDEPLIHELIHVAEKRFEAMNRGELADVYEVPLTPELAALTDKWIAIQQEIVKKYF